ncbi:MAG TPA: energy transducer TonB [Candidatus Polarisedimenticolaceae bacterium]|nr:energy transducer TonB [Candidatus Polarisedimenticolaceae bacterium]
MVRLRVALALSLALIPGVAVASRVDKEAIEVGPGIEPPKPGRTMTIPFDAVPSDLTGTVTARLLLDADGVVRKVKILTSTDARLKSRARELLSGAKFQPAMRDASPVAVWWTETVTFVSAEAEFASILACDPSKIETSAPVDPAGDASITLPILIRDAAPPTTTAIRKRGDGFAKLACVIDACGQVDDCKVLASSGNEYVDPAITAARERLYRPAHRGGKPIPVYFTLTITFEL